MMKAIVGYEEIYSIAENGRVWSHERTNVSINGKTKYEYKIGGKWLKPWISSKPTYVCITLYKNKKSKHHKIHRLIAQTFIPNLENKPEINHKNGIKLDNRIENLEWVTHKENMQHAYKNGLINKSANAKLNWQQIEEIRQNHVKKGTYTRKPWEKHNISRGHYYRVLNREIWSCNND